MRWEVSVSVRRPLSMPDTEGVGKGESDTRPSSIARPIFSFFSLVSPFGFCGMRMAGPLPEVVEVVVYCCN